MPTSFQASLPPTGPTLSSVQNVDFTLFCAFQVTVVLSLKASKYIWCEEMKIYFLKSPSEKSPTGRTYISPIVEMYTSLGATNLLEQNLNVPSKRKL